ncbi:MAG TPA: glutathione S-transferase N-terminal domain-containing protein [Reyranella sp.]|nr:glutathione S-transferase N-terminal domain-containing protein [Reyranella sp.]
MITLYDLVFDKDLRPSPFCWRTKLALKHKGLTWRDEPCGFGDKQKIAFANSQTYPVIHDATKVVKDSWAIAQHLDAAHPGRPLIPDRSYAYFVNSWADTVVNVAIFPIIVGDLFERVRPHEKAYIAESRGKRLGTTDFAGFQAKAREKGGLAAFRAALEPARRVLKDQKYLSGEAPAYPDYILLGSFLWPRTLSPLELLEKDDAIYAWRERMLDLFDGFARNAPAAG